MTVVPEMTPVAAATITTAVTPELEQTEMATPVIPTDEPPTKSPFPSWLVLLVGATVLIIIAIFVIAVWQFRRHSGTKV
jgi:heme/copper-type cytochrome/quinol oxidase subunit 2